MKKIRLDAFYIDTLQPEDAKGLCELMTTNYERFYRFMPKTLAQNQTTEDSKAYILSRHHQTEDKLTYTFAIKEKETHGIAGLVFIKDLDWSIMQGEFAYGMGAKYANQGIMSKAVKKLSDYAFTELDLTTLQIITHKTNLASVKMAENCGYKWVKTLPNEFTPPNESPLDMELFEKTCQG